MFLAVVSEAVGNGAGYSSGVDSAAALAAPLIMELKNGVSVRLHSLKGVVGMLPFYWGRFANGQAKNQPENLISAHLAQ